MTIEATPLFGIPVFQMELDDFEGHQDALIDMIYQLKDEDEGVERSNKGGWHSSGHLQQHDHPEVKWLMKQVFDKGVEAIKSYDHDRPFKGIRLHTSWININPSGTWNAPHMHLPSEWSGVVYIKVCEEPEKSGNQASDGDIMFFNPSPHGPQYNSKPVTSFTPKNGEIFLFPGYLLHMVAPHFEEEDRISVAFNFKLQGGQGPGGPGPGRRGPGKRRPL